MVTPLPLDSLPPAPCAVGIDSLYVSVYLDRLGIDWEGLRYAKEKLAAAPAVDFTEITLGGETFALKRGGRKPYSFILTNKAFELQLGENIQPRCHARFSSELLWKEGLERAWERFKTIWRETGCAFLRPEVIFRVDAAFDFAIGEPDFEIGHFVSQAAKDATWRQHGEEQTFQFGTGDAVVRIYNKVAEIEQASEKHWMYDLWETDEGVWRVEFQVRGERLKQAGIGTIEQLRAYLPSLIRHLARQHTSLRTPNRDSNRSRWQLHPMWRSVIASADALTNLPDSPPRPFNRGNLYNLERQLQSLGGNFKGLAATLSCNRPDRPVTLEQLLKWLPRMMRRRHSPVLWEADVRQKIRKRGFGL